MIAVLLSGLASTMCSFLLPWEVVQRTGNLGWAASAVGVSYLAQVVFSIPLGAWAEKHSHKMALSLLLVFSLLPTLATALVLTLTTSEAWLWALLAAQALLSLFAAAIASAAGAAAQKQDRKRASSSIASLVNARQTSWFAGMAIGAWVVATAGATAVPVISAAMIAASLVCCLGLPSAKPRRTHESLRKKLPQIIALRQLWPVTAIASAWNIAAGALTASLVPLMSYHGLGSAQMGAVYIFGAIGAMTAGMVLHYIASGKLEKNLAPTIFVWAAAVGAFSLVGNQILLVLVSWAVVMLANTSLAGLLAGMRASTIPPRLMISASQLTMIVRMSCFAAGGIVAGLLADRLGIEWVPALCAAWAILLVVPGYLLQKTK